MDIDIDQIKEWLSKETTIKVKNWQRLIVVILAIVGAFTTYRWLMDVI